MQRKASAADVEENEVFAPSRCRAASCIIQMQRKASAADVEENEVFAPSRCRAASCIIQMQRKASAADVEENKVFAQRRQQSFLFLIPLSHPYLPNAPNYPRERYDPAHSTDNQIKIRMARVVGTKPPQTDRMLDRRQARKANRRQHLLVSRCRGRSLVFRLDRQHHQENARWHNPPKILPATPPQQMVRTEQRAMPKDGTTGPNDRQRKSRSPGYVGQRLLDRPRPFAGITVRPRRMGTFLPPARIVQTCADRYHPDKKAPTETVQKPPGKIHGKHPARSALWLLGRLRTIISQNSVPPSTSALIQLYNKRPYPAFPRRSRKHISFSLPGKPKQRKTPCRF